jgi:RHS repeat-associated protein
VLEGSETRYTSYGEVRTDGPAVGGLTEFTYTGQQVNYYIKLVQMDSRWYDPRLGRFISPDTIVPDPADPQSLNRYSYVGNNPLKYVDPTGHVRRRPWVDGVASVEFALAHPELFDEPPIPTGAEPRYDADFWNNVWLDRPLFPSAKCYPYAVNDPYLERFGEQPGDAGKAPWDANAVTVEEIYAAITSDNLAKAARADKLEYIEIGESCSTDSYAVALFIDPYEGDGDRADYHWYRQDQGGYWSHRVAGQTTNYERPGHYSVLGESGILISDPRKANRGLSDVNGFSYTEFVGFFCVRSDPGTTD